MNDKKEKTALDISVGADKEQSIQKTTNNIIHSETEKSNDYNEKYDDWEKEMQLMMMPSYLKTVTMTSLYETIFEAQKPLIEGLINQGIYLFVGSPKIGKSFMMAQIAYHISTGTALWNYKVRKAPVLYFALEDDYARLQQRLYRMFGENSAEDLYLATDSHKLGSGLEEQIQNFMFKHPATGLIIIDTLKRVRDNERSDYSYGNDYDIVARFKNLADSYKITIIIVHHTRKQTADDKFDMISGTNGLLGAADGALVLTKNKRTDNEAVLEITGRDQQDQRLYLERDIERLIWKLKSVETELWKEAPEPIFEKIAAALASAGNEWSGSPTALTEFIGTDMKANVLTLKLNVGAGRLYSEYGIRYINKRCHDGRKVTLTLEQRDGV